MELILSNFTDQNQILSYITEYINIQTSIDNNFKDIIDS